MVDLAIGAALGVLASLAVAVALDRSDPPPTAPPPPPQVVVIEEPPPIVA